MNHIFKLGVVLFSIFQITFQSSPPTGSPTSSSFPTSTPTDWPTSQPTGVPSSQPTGQPTLQPTSQPSGNSTTQTAFLETVESDCIKFNLIDSFGDGWDSVRLVVYPSSESHIHRWYSPPCGTPTFTHEYCFDKKINLDGDYVILKVIGFNPEYEWEVKWTATNTLDGKTYFGNYGTTMNFIYHLRYLEGRTESSISLVKIVKADTSVLDCKSCVSYTSEGNKQGSKQLVQLSGYGMTWYYADGSGTNYYVSDTSGQKLYFSGTLCSILDNACSLNIADGTYTWRVTGATDKHINNIMWRFCSMRGRSSSEVQFTISGSTCTPSSEILTISDICSQKSSTAIDDAKFEQLLTLEGVIELKGVSSVIETQSKASMVIATALQQEFNDACAHVNSDGSIQTGFADILSIDQVHSSLSSQSLQEPSRQLSSSSLSSPSSDSEHTVTHRVMFHIQVPNTLFTPSDLSTQRSPPLTSMKNYLQESMDSGLFLARIRKASSTTGDLSLSSVTAANVVELTLIHQTDRNKRESFIASTFVAGSVVVGVIFGGLLTMYLIRRRSPIFYTHLPSSAQGIEI